MTRIDFYVLDSTGVSERLNFCCRLTEKAVKQGLKVLIWLENSEQEQEVDALLWQFKPESFIPHERIKSAELNPKSPVALSSASDLPTGGEVLINMSTRTPATVDRFLRIAEIVNQEKKVLNSTRQHYSNYRDQGYKITTHRWGA